MTNLSDKLSVSLMLVLLAIGLAALPIASALPTLDQTCGAVAAGSATIGDHQPIGQVFTPAQATVVAFQIFASSANGVATPMTARVLNGGEGGAVLGSVDFSVPASFAPGWIGASFASGVSVTPGSAYGLDLQDHLSSSGVSWYECSSPYAGGNAYATGASLPPGAVFSFSESYGDFTVAPSPASITIVQSASSVETGTVGVIVSSMSGFDSPVTLSASGIPTGVSASFSANPVTPAAGGSSTSLLTFSVTPAASVGGYTVTLAGASGTISHAATVTLNVASSGDFSIAVSPSYVGVLQGDMAVLPVTVSTTSGFSTPVTLSVSGAPAGVTVGFSTNPVTPPNTVEMSIGVSTYVPPGTYGLTITGASGSASHATQLLIVVIVPGPPPDFILTVTPPNATITQGASGGFTVNLVPVNGFSGPVGLNLANVPPGVFVNFAANPVTVPTSVSVNVGGTVQVSSTVAAGSYPVTVIGTSASLYHSTTLTLIVAQPGPAPDFALSANPNGVTVAQGSSAQATVDVTATSTFSQAVALSTPNMPAGFTSSFTQSTVTPTPGNTAASTITVSVSASAATGQYAVSVTGVSGSLTHTTILQVQVTPAVVPDFTLTAQQAAFTLQLASSYSTAVTITSTNGFSSPVALSTSWLGSVPTGASINLPSPITPPPNSAANSPLTLTTQSTTPLGSYLLQITATSGTTIHTAQITVTVTQPPPPQCVIATATYGSALAPEVQTLRNFRDKMLMRTYAGANFMTAFNAWYYSWAPPVAQYENTHQTERTAMRYALYPMIGIFATAAATYQLTAPASPEAAAAIATLTAGTLIGLIYIAPPLTILGLGVRRLQNMKRQKLITRLLLAGLLTGLATLLVGELLAISPLVMAAGLVLVSSAIALASTETSARLVHHFA